MNSPAPQSSQGDAAVGTRSATGRVSHLATAGAVVSCLGLGIGHLLGLALGIAAVRRMDRSNGSLYGHRLVLTGCLVGLMGLFWVPFGLPPLLHAPIRPQFLLLALVSQVEFPLFMLLFGLQDWLRAPQCEYGYRFMGPHQQRFPLDVAIAIIGSLLGAGLAVWGLLRDWPADLAIAVVGSGCLLLLISLGALVGRRGCRALWMFLVIALALGAAVYLQRL